MSSTARMHPLKNFFLRATGIAPLVGPIPLFEEDYRDLFKAETSFADYSHPPKASYGVASPRRTNAYCLRRRALSETFGGWLYSEKPHLFLSGVNPHFNRHSRREFVQIRLSRMQLDFDDDALGDFDEIAGAAVGLDDAEFGGGRRGDFANATAEMRAAEGIDGDVRLLAAADVFHVRFLDVGDYPARGGDDRHQLRARADELAFFDGDFAQQAVGGRIDGSVSQLLFGQR